MLARRKPLKRNTSPLKRSPIRRVSKKRAVQLRAYYVARERYLREHPICEVWCRERNVMWMAPGVYQDCKPLTSGTVAGADLIGLGAPLATEIHHTNKRRGAMLLDETHWLAVCRANHERIEQDKAWARREGFLLNF